MTDVSKKRKLDDSEVDTSASPAKKSRKQKKAKKSDTKEAKSKGEDRPDELYGWQQHVVDNIKSEHDSKEKIHWVQGSIGNTFLVKRLASRADIDVFSATIESLADLQKCMKTDDAHARSAFVFDFALVPNGKHEEAWLLEFLCSIKTGLWPDRTLPPHLWVLSASPAPKSFVDSGKFEILSVNAETKQFDAKDLCFEDVADRSNLLPPPPRWKADAPKREVFYGAMRMGGPCFVCSEPVDKKGTTISAYRPHVFKGIICNVCSKCLPSAPEGDPEQARVIGYIQQVILEQDGHFCESTWQRKIIKIRRSDNSIQDAKVASIHNQSSEEFKQKHKTTSDFGVVVGWCEHDKSATPKLTIKDDATHKAVPYSMCMELNPDLPKLVVSVRTHAVSVIASSPWTEVFGK